MEDMGRGHMLPWTEHPLCPANRSCSRRGDLSNWRLKSAQQRGAEKKEAGLEDDWKKVKRLP